MIGPKLKTLLALGVVTLLGATPAMAYSPRPVYVGVSTPAVSIGFGWHAPVVHAPRYDSRLMRRGLALEREGQELVERGRRLEHRGLRFGSWHMKRKGERLQARGWALVREGQELQARARW